MNNHYHYIKLLKKVRKESTLEGLKKLEESNDRLYENCCLEGYQFRQIDLLIMDKIAKINLIKIGE